MPDHVCGPMIASLFHPVGSRLLRSVILPRFLFAKSLHLPTEPRTPNRYSAERGARGIPVTWAEIAPRFEVLFRD